MRSLNLTNEMSKDDKYLVEIIAYGRAWENRRRRPFADSLIKGLMEVEDGR